MQQAPLGSLTPQQLLQRQLARRLCALQHLLHEAWLVGEAGTEVGGEVPAAVGSSGWSASQKPWQLWATWQAAQQPKRPAARSGARRGSAPG